MLATADRSTGGAPGHRRGVTVPAWLQYMCGSFLDSLPMERVRIHALR